MTDASTVRGSVNHLMIELRPRLHRYCARIVGSVFEGEDVVQEALAKAAEALPTAQTVANPERWLFTIAHNTALDFLRRRKRHAEVPLEEDSTDLPTAQPEADAWAAASSSLGTLMQLPVIQRSTVVMMDVLEHSLFETAEILGSTLPATKAALHRGRVRLRSLADAPDTPTPLLSPDEVDRVRRYAERFNARDFDTLRELLAEDVRLDLVNRLRLTGRSEVARYFSRYAAKPAWRLAPCLAEGGPALIVHHRMDARTELEYVIVLEWHAARISGIRDFRFAPYVMDGLQVHPLQ